MPNSSIIYSILLARLVLKEFRVCLCVVANGFGYIAAIRTKRRLKMKPGAIGAAVAEKALQPPALQRLRAPACCLLSAILSRLGGLVLYGAVALHSQIVKSAGKITIVSWVFRLFASVVDMPTLVI